MHRFFTADACAAGSMVTLTAEDAKHAAQVVRLRAGEEVALLDGRGGVFSAMLESVSKQGVSARITGMLPDCEPSLRVTLYQGMAKGEKMDLIVQKATELGVHAVQPVLMGRSVPKGEEQAHKRERLMRIAEGAVKQCGRGHVPLIGQARPLDALLPAIARHACIVVPWEEAWDGTIASAYEAAGRPQDAALIIGPEGGIAREEMARLTVHGARPVTLGPRILRTETAAITALALLMRETGEI